MRFLLPFLLVACSGDGSGDDTGSTTDTDTSTTDTDTSTTDTDTSTTDTDTSTTEFWTPAPGTSWQWQLSGNIDTSVAAEVFDIDLFDVPQNIRDTLHADGKIVICYFSAGSREDWRDDADDFDQADIGNPLDGWPGERWVDIRSPALRTIMEARLDVAVTSGCDAVEPDNVDGYSNNSGFPLSEVDQLDYNRFLAAAAHSRGLSVGLKNAVEIAGELEPDFDWALNEECVNWNECGELQPFIDAGKAVFHTEYVDRENQGPAMQAQVCGEPSIADFSTLIKTWDLDAWFLTCP